MEVLFITNHYLNLNIGGPNASKGLIQTFAKVFPSMSLVYPDFPDSNIESFIPQQVIKIPYYDNRTDFKKIIDIYRGRLHRYHHFIKHLLHTNKYDLIIIDHSVIWASLTRVLKESGATLVTIHHNVEKKYLRDNPANILYRFPLRRYAEKAEYDAVNFSDINLTLTNKDIEDFKELFPHAKGRFYHLGAIDYQSIDFMPSTIREPNTFIITGALCFPQSNIPIIEFVKELYPIICRLFSDNLLIIAGREPSTEMEEICQLDKRIQLIKNPPEMHPLLQRASYYICPINMGSGQKTRVSDGLKNGLPVLCHEVSAYGYEGLKEKGFIYTYHDKETFERALVNMTSSTLSQIDVFNAYEACFSIEAGANRLISILKKENII